MIGYLFNWIPAFAGMTIKKGGGNDGEKIQKLRRKDIETTERYRKNGKI